MASTHLQQLVDKRVASLEYLQNVSTHYFHLGGSLPLLVARREPLLNEFLKQLLQLFREYESLKSAGESSRNKISGVGRKLFRSRKSDAGLEPVKSRASSISGPSPTSPTSVVPGEYLHLKVFPLPFPPDICQTFLSLCDSLIQTYRHIERSLDNHVNLTIENYELLCKVDDKVNKHFVNPTVKEIDSLSRSLIYEETSKLGARLVRV